MFWWVTSNSSFLLVFSLEAPPPINYSSNFAFVSRVFFRPPQPPCLRLTPLPYPMICFPSLTLSPPSVKSTHFLSWPFFPHSLLPLSFFPHPSFAVSPLQAPSARGCCALQSPWLRAVDHREACVSERLMDGLWTYIGSRGWVGRRKGRPRWSGGVCSPTPLWRWRRSLSCVCTCHTGVVSFCRFICSQLRSCMCWCLFLCF